MSASGRSEECSNQSQTQCMIEAKLFMKKGALGEQIRWMLEKDIVRGNLPVHLMTITDSASFVAEDIHVLPTLLVNGHRLEYRGEWADIPKFVYQGVKMILEERKHPDRVIVVPTDFSEDSEHAFKYAWELARKMHADLHLVHVFFPTASAVDGLIYVDPELEKTARENLDQFTGRMILEYSDQLPASPKISSVFKVGQVVKEIENLSLLPETISIVMGSTGSGDVFKQIFGSVSTAVTKHAGCPVFVIPPNVQWKPYKHILFASADTTMDDQSIQAIKYYTGSSDCDIDMVYMYAGENEYSDHDPEVLHENKAKHFKEVILFEDDLIEGLNEYAKDASIDLIVMSRKDRTVWADFFHKSATRSMTINTNFPLLVLHEKDIKVLKHDDVTS